MSIVLNTPFWNRVRLRMDLGNLFFTWLQKCYCRRLITISINYSIPITVGSWSSYWSDILIPVTVLCFSLFVITSAVISLLNKFTDLSQDLTCDSLYWVNVLLNAGTTPDLFSSDNCIFFVNAQIWNFRNSRSVIISWPISKFMLITLLLKVYFVHRTHSTTVLIPWNFMSSF